MIELAYRIVDVFTDRPLAGNPLCVVLDSCPEALMGALAREANLSETTFPVVVEDGGYEMRIFTPSEELPFAGHPSLGTAWVLGPGRWRQTTAGATVEVEADGDGAVMTQPDATFVEVDPVAPAAALGLQAALGAWQATAGGMSHVIVPTEEPLDRLRADVPAMRPGRTTLAVRPLDDRSLQVRAFMPGIGEDPATGSAAGPVAVLARRLWGTAIDVVVHQGAEVGRPSTIEVHAEEGAVRVGGRVVASAEGRFTLAP